MLVVLGLALVSLMALYSHMRQKVLSAHVHGRYFAAMYTLYMRELPPEPMCDHAFVERFYPQSETELRQFVDRYRKAHGIRSIDAPKLAKADGDFVVCVMRNTASGLYHGIKLVHRVDNGNSFWCEDYATAGYDTVEVARSHIAILYPGSQEIVL